MVAGPAYRPSLARLFFFSTYTRLFYPIKDGTEPRILARLLRSEGQQTEAAAEVREALSLLETAAADLREPTLRRCFEESESLREARGLASDP